MTDLSKAELKKRWGTMRKIVSAEPRARQIVQRHPTGYGDQTSPLMDSRGNAMLVGSSIYQACKFYELFSQAGFKGKCAIVTSYEPQAGDIAKEDSGEESIRDGAQVRHLPPDARGPFRRAGRRWPCSKVEQFEKTGQGDASSNEPGQMRLLIVVDKLLTGFDAPVCDLPVHRQADAGPRPLPGHLPREPARRRRQGLRLHRRLPRPLQLTRRAPSPTTPAVRTRRL